MSLPMQERWGPDDAEFVKAGGMKMVKKPDPVWMMPLNPDNEHRVYTNEGSLLVRAGDPYWLAYDPVSGHVWPVSEQYVLQHYEVESSAKEEEATGYWTCQVNDLVGGFIVTNFPHPLSEHPDTRPPGGDAPMVACETHSEGFARLIADLLNHADDGHVEVMGT